MIIQRNTPYTLNQTLNWNSGFKSGGILNHSTVERPGHLRTVTSLLKQLLTEVRVEPVGAAARARVTLIHARSVSGIEQSLAQSVVDELEGITLPFCGQERPSPGPGMAQGRRASRVDRLLDDIEAAQSDQHRQRQRRAAADGPAGAIAGESVPSPGQEDPGEMSAGATL